ncbi:MAG: type II secretion system protein F [Actinomyces sp.]|nr:type II secretion system protein F [Actinomyces sp.]
MSATLIGIVLGIGVNCILLAFVGTPQLPRWSPNWWQAWNDTLIRSGISSLTRTTHVLVTLAIMSGVFLGVLAYTRTWTVAIVVALMIAPVPTMMIVGRAARVTRQTRAAWPDVVDQLVAGIRSGASLPELLIDCGERGPQIMRPYFLTFSTEYRADGRFDHALTGLKNRLADPVADRIIEALRLARDVGGSDLAILLRDLGIMLREDARIRGELEARQSWTVNAARLGVAAPWIVLVLISAQAQAASAFSTPQGVAVLSVGALVSVVAYFVMKQIGKLETERRTLR